MKTHKVDNIKRIDQLDFDDIIQGNNYEVTYTHWSDNKPMFLLGDLRLEKPYYKGIYLIGFSNMIKFLKSH